MGQPSVPALHAVSDRSVDMARKLADKKTLTHEGWLELRKSSIGGSEIAAILGMNPYSSAITVYADKHDLSKPIVENEAMREGRELEWYVADRYMEKTGKKVRNDFYVYADDEYDYMTANIDRRIVGENAGLECKRMLFSANDYNFEAGEVPKMYYVQCQWYCMIFGFDHMDFAVWVPGKGVYVVTIPRNDDFISDMRSRAIDFWENNVLAHRMPVPDGSEASIETLKEIYPKPVENTSVMIPGLDKMVSDYKELNKMAQEYTKRADQIKADICRKIGTNEVAIGNDYECSWKMTSRTGFDKDRLKADHPEIYSKYVTKTSYRKFGAKKHKKEK